MTLDAVRTAALIKELLGQVLAVLVKLDHIIVGLQILIPSILDATINLVSISIVDL